MKKYICLSAAAILVSSCAYKSSVAPIGQVDKTKEWELYQIPISALPYIEVALRDFRKNHNVLEFQIGVISDSENVNVIFQKIPPEPIGGIVTVCAGNCGGAVYQFRQKSLTFTKPPQR